MTYFTPETLLRSDIVANRTMNRERGLRGVNSYERELGIDPAALLQTGTEAAWFDVCCGEGRALREAADALAGRPVRLIGIDLVGPFAPSSHEGLAFIEADALAYEPPFPLSLITCVHGLHYLGDKLGFLERAYRWLAPGGIFAGHLDPDNVRNEEGGRPFWLPALRLARKGGAQIALRAHRLRIVKTDAPLDFGADYCGARPSGAPNYTSITVIDSWYRSRG